jgi:hypothetical protein
MFKKNSLFLILLSITFAWVNLAIAQTGENTYSGEWEGTLGTHGFHKEYSGTWQFDVDFDEGEVEGWFKGDGAGDITGTVSDGIIEASGEAAYGVVLWFGEYSSNGEEISGTWEISESASEFGEGSGTWSGYLKKSEEESPEEEELEGLPQEDQAAVEEERLERYPGSVALNYESMRVTEGSVTRIEYVTEDSLEDVANWFKGKLGKPTLEESSAGETKLGYRFEESTGWVEIEISTNDYTTIELEHFKAAH